MKHSKTLFTGLLVLGLLCLSGMAAAQEDTTVTDTTGTVLTDDIQPYDGPIGAGSPLYGLKIAMEDIDETFTSNQSERVNKQIGHGRLRIAEMRRALELNQSGSAEQALGLYGQKMNLTRSTIASFRSNATALLHAQEQIVKHRFVLENLLLRHPDNTGLLRAYTNSLELEEKFSEKTAIKFNRSAGKDNRTILRAIGIGQKEMEQNRKQTMTPQVNETHTRSLVTGTQDPQTEREKNQNKKPVPDTTNTVTTQPTTSGTGNPQQGQLSDDKQNGNSANKDNKGKGNSPNN